MADEESVRAEREILWEYHLARSRAGVPPDRLYDRTIFSEPPAFRLVQCVACRSVYRNPAERSTALQEAYRAPEIDSVTLGRILESQRRLYRHQLRALRHLAGPSPRGLEVGSYAGAFLSAARDAGMTFEGLDVNDDAVSYVQRLGFRATAGALETFTAHQPFDVIAIWNTFDQLPSPRAALHAALRILRPGGVVAIRVPNGDYYARHRLKVFGNDRLARSWNIALLALNNLLSFPYRWGFSYRGLTQLLAETGFSVVHARGDVLPSLADEYTRRLSAAKELALKAALRRVIGARPHAAPWMEVYARSPA